jgi:phosphopantetheinyl transferase
LSHKVFTREITTFDLSAPQDPEDAPGAEKFTCQKRKTEFLSARAFLRQIAREHYGIEALKLTYDGPKPQIADGKFHFSISHSHGLLAIVTSKAPVGADLEHINQTRPLAKLIKRFPEHLQAQFLALPQNERPTYFYTLWTKYEALIKLHGKTFPARTFDPAHQNANFTTQNTHGDYILTIAEFL